MAYCKRCGSALKDGANFCGSCGAASGAVEKLSVFGYFVKCLKRYADFNGRARRKEFWGYLRYQYVLLAALFILFLPSLAAMMGVDLDTIVSKNIWYILFGVCFWHLAFFVPNLAVSVRRLHDAGYSGGALWWILTVAGAVYPLILFCMDSEPWTNDYGISPKYPNDNAPKRIGRRKAPVILAAAVCLVWVVIGAVALNVNYGNKAAKKMSEAPGELALFESAYSAALSKNGGSNAIITSGNFTFTPSAESKLFKYDLLVNENSYIVGYMAAALSDIGRFAKDGYLQTIYVSARDEFVHCVGGVAADKALAAAKSLIPEFFSGGASICSERPVRPLDSSDYFTDSRDDEDTDSERSAATAGNIDSMLVNNDGEAWTGYSMRTFYSIVFNSDGTFTKSDTYGYGNACEDGEECDPENECGVCTSEEIGIWHTDGNRITMTYYNDGGKDYTMTGSFNITPGGGEILDELEIEEDGKEEVYWREYQRTKRPVGRGMELIDDIADAMTRPLTKKKQKSLDEMFKR